MRVLLSCSGLVLCVAVAFACSSSSSPSSPGVAGPAADGGGGAEAGPVGDNPDAATPASDSGSNPGTPPTACAETGASLAPGPCQGSAFAASEVPRGCTPHVDGTPHVEEWKDAACFTVGTSDMNVYVKYAGDALYMATIGNPTCGCGMSFNFLPSGGTTLSADQFSIIVLDDPFNADGDRSEGHLVGGTFKMAPAPAGIVTACPGSQPVPVPFEWKIPLTALQIAPGAAHTFRMAIVHAAAHYPSGLVLDGSQLPSDPSSWATFGSSKNWQ